MSAPGRGPKRHEVRNRPFTMSDRTATTSNRRPMESSGRGPSSRTSARRVVLPATVASLLLVAVACGTDDGSALDSLPPIRTTTTLSTTSTSIDIRRIYYQVKAGDYLSDIAARYQVTVRSIMDLNQLDTDVLQVDQVLEIPNDMRFDATLPPLPESTIGP